MEEDESTQPLTQCTQEILDPRREGKNNSGLATEDISDVMCIFHPCSPAAFNLANYTARRAPQFILEGIDTTNIHEEAVHAPKIPDDDQKTFIIDGNEHIVTNSLHDFAFRFSTETVQPGLGITFGRNPDMADIVVSGDVHKRVSNLHFALYMNESGVIMVADSSTNGTMVDDVLLKGRSNGHYPHSRMLNHGSIIQILSPTPEEAIKFVVRIPSRVGFFEQYTQKFTAYIHRQIEKEIEYRRVHEIKLVSPKWASAQPGPNTSVIAPIISNQYGMHWDGGMRFNVIGQLGKGAFATVYQLATKGEGTLYAAKELEKRKFMKNGVLDHKLENEMNIMQKINHRSIVAYHGCEDAPNHLYIIMEYVQQGDLQKHLNETGPLLEHTGKAMASQVLDALDYLHKKNITHRDIKPDNILLEYKEPHHFVIKLSDFGLSKVVDTNETFLKTFCGTLLYCAPEVFPHYSSPTTQGIKRPHSTSSQQAKKLHTYDQAVDIWSFGAVLWFALSHKPPFEGVADPTGRGMFDKIMMSALDMTLLRKFRVTEVAISLMVSMLTTNPSTRPSAETCLQHKWFSDQPLPVRRPREPGLGAIVEEPEGEDVTGEPNVAALSLKDEPDSRYSEVSLNSSDIDFFDPRESKRLKAEHDNGVVEELIDSSPELYDEIPIALEDERQAQAGAENRPKATKLFGEISRSDLARPQFEQRANDALGTHASSICSDQPCDGSHQEAQRPVGRQVERSPSLRGAESLVRGMNMNSAHKRTPSPADADDETEAEAGPRIPSSFEVPSKSEPSKNTPAANTTDTAAQKQDSPFSRQIHLPIPYSYYWDPDDPSTHTIEYSERVSNRSYAEARRNPGRVICVPASALVGRSPEDFLPGTVPSTTTTPVDSAVTRKEGAAAYGRLVSTRDSFDRIVVDLNKNCTRWGRDPTNDAVYPVLQESRVPKAAFSVFFVDPVHSAIARTRDLPHLPDLLCGIMTFASCGIEVNGVRLQRGENGKQPWGQIYSGDVVDIWPNRRAGDRLRFKVEIYTGTGRQRRPKGAHCFKLEPGTLESNKSTTNSAAAEVPEPAIAATAADEKRDEHSQPGSEQSGPERSRPEQEDEEEGGDMSAYADEDFLVDGESDIVDSF